MDKTPFQRACEIVGGQAAIARRLNISPAFAYQLHSGRRPVPAELCPDIEFITDRQVTCEELLPGVNWAYLRGRRRSRKSSLAS